MLYGDCLYNCFPMVGKDIGGKNIYLKEGRSSKANFVPDTIENFGYSSVTSKDSLQYQRAEDQDSERIENSSLQYKDKVIEVPMGGKNLTIQIAPEEKLDLTRADVLEIRWSSILDSSSSLLKIPVGSVLYELHNLLRIILNEEIIRLNHQLFLKNSRKAIGSGEYRDHQGWWFMEKEKLLKNL